LDPSVARRIISRLNWFSENFEQIRITQLTGDFTGLYKFRVGDYRIIYSIDHTTKTIKILDVVHRKDAYKKR
jgi:mRNA interferase RelE/StbE